MKYDVDLQEIDAIRRARNVYEEESAPSGGRKREKECSVAGKRRGKKKRKRKERGEGGGERPEIYASDYYATDATSGSCLS